MLNSGYQTACSLALVLAAQVGSATAVTLPPGFLDTQAANVGATALAFTPDGRLLLAQQAGVVRLWRNGLLLPAPALTLPDSQVCYSGERGLLGVAVDPTFNTNQAIYLYYTSERPNGECYNRVARFVLGNDDRIDLASEQILVDNVRGFGNHNAGDLHFGPDDQLYVSTGDGGTPNSQRHLLNGKLLRITRDGGVPADNPFQGPGTASCALTGGTTAGLTCREIFALGLRNPFRFAFDRSPGATRFHINDVGASAWEEINLGQRGADYGWPGREGHCAAGSTTLCSPANPPGPGITDPIHDYGRDTGCRVITGGAFVPNGAWPGYDGRYLFSDYGCGRLFALSPAAPYTASVFGDGLYAAIALSFGPHHGRQALYYTTATQVRRVTYEPVDQAPTGTLSEPAEGSTFASGQSLSLAAFGQDPQDGNLPDSAFTWTVVLRYLGMQEPVFGPVTGNHLTFVAPPLSQPDLASQGLLEVHLELRDSDGYAAEIVRTIQPRRVSLSFASVPAGLDVVVGTRRQATPFDVLSWEGHTWSIEALPGLTAGPQGWSWQSWSDGGAQAHALVTPAEASTLTASYAPRGVLTFDPAATREGDLGSHALGVRARLLGDTGGQSVQARVQATGGSATPALDYAPFDIPLQLSAAQREATFTLDVHGDVTPESNESIVLGFVGLSGGLGDPQAPPVIIRDDEAPAADFDGDGRGDILFRSTTLGSQTAWAMHGLARQAVFPWQGNLAQATLLGVADVDLDGLSDQWWRRSDGRLELWLTRTPSAHLTVLPTPATAPLEWQCASTADLDGDGRPDLLWRHATSGKLVAWLMDGAVRRSGQYLSPDALTDLNWRLVGAGDLDRDGSADLVWRHDLSGQLVGWRMQGLTRVSGGYLVPSVVPDLGWKLVGVGDFGADGRADLLWRHALSGRLVVWSMNGLTRTAGAFTQPDGEPDLTLQVVAPH